MGKKNDLKSEGWNKVSHKVIAKGSSSWLDEQGRLHFKEVVPTGSASFVKKALAPKNNGEKSELEFAHTTDVYEKEVEIPGTEGVIKEREVMVCQSHSIGDDETPASTPTEAVTTSTFATSDPSPLSDDFKKWAKNTYDNLENKTTLMWIAIIAAIALGVGGLVLSILK